MQGPLLSIWIVRLNRISMHNKVHLWSDAEIIAYTVTDPWHTAVSCQVSLTLRDMCVSYCPRSENSASHSDHFTIVIIISWSFCYGHHFMPGFGASAHSITILFQMTKIYVMIWIISKQHNNFPRMTQKCVMIWIIGAQNCAVSSAESHHSTLGCVSDLSACARACRSWVQNPSVVCREKKYSYTASFYPFARALYPVQQTLRCELTQKCVYVDQPLHWLYMLWRKSQYLYGLSISERLWDTARCVVS